MNYLFIGNIIAFFASLVMIYSGTLKNKKKILYFQTIQIGLFIFSNLILGGFSGAIINVISFVRNLLCYNNKFGLNEKILVTLFSVISIIIFNNLGFIGFLPMISTVTYVWFMNIKNVEKFKILIIFTMMLWLIYDIFIKSYTSAIFDGLTIIVNAISIFKIKKQLEVK